MTGVQTCALPICALVVFILLPTLFALEALFIVRRREGHQCDPELPFVPFRPRERRLLGLLRPGYVQSVEDLVNVFCIGISHVGF